MSDSSENEFNTKILRIFKDLVIDETILKDGFTPFENMEKFENCDLFVFVNESSCLTLANLRLFLMANFLGKFIKKK